METRIASAIAGGTARDAASKLAADVKGQLAGQEPVLVAVFASTSQPLSELMPALKEHFPSGVLIGSSTSGEFTQNGDAKASVSVFALTGDFQVFAGMGIGLAADMEGTVHRAVADLPASAPGFPHRTAVVLLDALAGSAEEVTLTAAALLGGEVRMAGGAAGDDLQMKTCKVACGARASDDAVVVAVLYSKKPLGVGVCHGHDPISRPLRITKADGNVVSEIEGRNAWEVWADETRESAARRGVDPRALSPDEVNEHLIRYEAGLATGGALKIRVPLSRGPEGSLHFACGVPEGSVIRITESFPERQVESARAAARRAITQMGDAPVAGALVFDCVCRYLILKERFGDAVKAIADELGGVPLAGFETYGEIALDAGDMSGFHNTTTVVLAFPR